MSLLLRLIKQDVRRSFRRGPLPFDRRRMWLPPPRRTPSPDANIPSFQTAQMPTSSLTPHHLKRQEDKVLRADFEATPAARRRQQLGLHQCKRLAKHAEDECQKEWHVAAHLDPAVTTSHCQPQLQLSGSTLVTARKRMQI